MKLISVTLGADGSIESITQDKLYVEEHECAQLVITLAGELAAEDIDFHIISFAPTGTNKKSATQNIYALDEISSVIPDAYLSEGELFCTLPYELCSNKNLCVQVEAYKQSGDEPSFIAKSAVFSITFENSLTGCAQEISADAFGLLPRLHAMLDEVKAVVESPIVQGISTTAEEITLSIPLNVPTPELTSNSNRAATTAYVQGLINEIFSDLNSALENIIGGDL